MKIDTLKLIDIEVAGVDMKDAPDFCDAYIADAWIRVESGDEFPRNVAFEYCPETKKLFRRLTEKELDWLQDNEPDWIFTQVEKSVY